MAVSHLKSFLDKNRINYRTSLHQQTFTAKETAASAHISGKELAKTVMVKIDGSMAMAVLPSSYNIDLDRLKEVSGAMNVELASEDEFEELFPDCETGAMPPFGNLYGMNVYVDEHLGDDYEISFNAGIHTELITLAYIDFEKLVHPKKSQFAC